MSRVGEWLRYEVWTSVWCRADERIKDQVKEDGRGPLSDEVWDQVWKHVDNQIRDQIKEQTYDKAEEVFK